VYSTGRKYKVQVLCAVYRVKSADYKGTVERYKVFRTQYNVLCAVYRVVYTK
jgi:hypothetical protein